MAEWERQTPDSPGDESEPKADFTPVSVWVSRITSPPPRVRTGLRWALFLSMLAHISLSPVLPRGGLGQSEKAEEAQTEYMKRTQAAKAAKIIAPNIRRQIAKAPPPPDPEDVVTETMSQRIDTDVERMIGGVLNVEVTGEIAKQVKASLKEELQAAAQKIAQGEYSEEEIQAFQERVKREAHTTMVQALEQHRDKTQVQRASLSVTEWYEQHLGKVLKIAIKHGLFGVPGRQYSYGVWPNFNRRGDTDAIRFWGGDRSHFGRIMGEVSNILKGQYSRRHLKPAGKHHQHGTFWLVDWPKPTEQQAEAINKLVKAFRKSWPGPLNRYLQYYRPHEAETLAKTIREKTESLWANAEEQGEVFMELGYDEAEEEEMKKARDDVFGTLKAILEAGKSAYVGDLKPYWTLNRAIRSRILRGPLKDELYDHFVKSMVDGLEFGVMDLARGQFKEGIRIRRDKTDKTRDKFTLAILMLMRRDVKAAYPKPSFHANLFTGSSLNPYKSPITGKSIAPNKDQVQKDESAAAKVLSDKPKLQAYVKGRTAFLEKAYRAAIDRVLQTLLAELVEDGRLKRHLYVKASSVDYQDRVREKLDARQAAMDGRGQDLAALTPEGVPETSGAQVALMRGGSAGSGASLQPVMTTMIPDHITKRRSALAIRSSRPRRPPRAAGWGFVEQATIKPTFKKPSPGFEAIPFLPVFPRLDGDLKDWGKVRPLVLTKNIKTGPKEPVLVYAAWNYQGFFFGVRAEQPKNEFSYPGRPYRQHDPIAGGTTMTTKYGPHDRHAMEWAFRGDNFRLLFDTVNGRSPAKGEPWTQEFVIFPRGTIGNPDFPGVERRCDSRRDAKDRKFKCYVFPAQPIPEEGPDGSGPYRIVKVHERHYTMEVFVPRSQFKVPIFCPGWTIGFETALFMGSQPGYMRHGKVWATKPGGHAPLSGEWDYPNRFGDLRLLGTDARFIVQDADEKGSRSKAVLPGHSYLLTVMDPDRNISMAAVDTVLVSVEADGATGDVEVFILKETSKNSSTFRGYVNTQPGLGRSVPAVLEVMPGQEVRFGYVDIANAKGERNVIYEQRLPVVSGMLNMVAKGSK